MKVYLGAKTVLFPMLTHLYQPLFPAVVPDTQSLAVFYSPSARIVGGEIAPGRAVGVKSNLQRLSRSVINPPQPHKLLFLSLRSSER